MLQIAQLPLPWVIEEEEYLPGHEVNGGWMDVQDVLRGLLYQGELAVSPLPRLQALEDRALALLKSDPDSGLFVLFQALPDLDANANAIAIQHIKLENEGWERDYEVPEPKEPSFIEPA